MRRLFFFLLPPLISLGAGTAAAQNWHWLSPKPQGVAVNAIAAFGTQEWLVGDLGTIATTTDGAQTFTPQASGTFANLNGVFFFDATHGWAVGDAGTLLSTSDGGNHWVAQNSSSTRKLRGVYFTSLLKGFAVGDYRTLLESQDGGQTWAGLGSVVLSLDAITFTDPLHGFICGDTGSILVTTDGGTSFNLVQTGTTAHLLAITFADANHGYAVGLGGAVVATADGGHSWSAQVIGTDDLTGVAVLSATRAYALGTDGVVYATADGSTWSSLESLKGTGAFNVLAVEQDGSLDAACQTGQWFHSLPMLTPDAGPVPGLTPVFADVNDLFSTAADITAVAFGSLDAGVMIGELGFLFNTLDRGRTVNLVGPPDAGPDVGWIAVSMPTPTDAFAVGTLGSVAVSHDSGQTWAFIPVPIPEDLTAVQFLDAQHGIIAATGGLLFVTANAGASWEIFGSSLGGNADAIAFSDFQHGVVVGDFGQVAWTVDGQTYNPGFVSPGFTLFAAAYPSVGVVIAAGDFGTIAHSLNQGSAFYALNPPTGAAINAMTFLDHQNGFLGGGVSSGAIFGTHDGAQSFDTQFMGATSILGISFVDRLHGYAVGGNGAVLATDTGGESGCQSDADCLDGGNFGVQCLAGACQPCTEDSRCGPACQACSAASPSCYGVYCGSCLSDLDCPEDGGYCVLGICQVPKTFDLDAGPDGGEDGDGGVTDGGTETDGGLDGGPGDGGSSGTTTGGGGTTTGSNPPPTCDGGSCRGSSSSCASGGGIESMVAIALGLAFCWPRRRRQ